MLVNVILPTDRLIAVNKIKNNPIQQYIPNRGWTLDQCALVLNRLDQVLTIF